ncbi:MAG: hypothetical protein J6T10_06390 [Methanobrevibacter sp.]|nr:hypothetical protein [Methanobrevibacter sp.]
MQNDVFIELLKTFLPEMDMAVANDGNSVVAKFKHSDEFTIKLSENGSVVVPYDLTYEYSNLSEDYCIRSINKNGVITDGWNEDVWLDNVTVDELKQQFIRIHKKYLTLLSEIKKVKFASDFE